MTERRDDGGDITVGAAVTAVLTELWVNIARQKRLLMFFSQNNMLLFFLYLA